MKELKLSKGLVALVDDEDFENVTRFKWHALRKTVMGKPVYYAARTVKDRENSAQYSVYLHRYIVHAALEAKVDHADGNTLNNLRSNLRICTKAQNNMNARKPSHGRSTPYKGVVLFKRDGTYRAYIKKDQKQYHLGYFATPEEGALAYNKAAQELFGEFARLNEVS